MLACRPNFIFVFVFFFCFFVVLFVCFFFFFKQKTAYGVRLSFVGSEMWIGDRPYEGPAARETRRPRRRDDPRSPRAAAPTWVAAVARPRARVVGAADTPCAPPLLPSARPFQRG